MMLRRRSAPLPARRPRRVRRQDRRPLPDTESPKHRRRRRRRNCDSAGSVDACCEYPVVVALGICSMPSRAARGACIEIVAINRRGLLAEEYARMRHVPDPCRDRHAGRPQATAREERDDDQIVGRAVVCVNREDQHRA